MHGGRLVVRGSAGRQLGGVYRRRAGGHARRRDRRPRRRRRAGRRRAASRPDRGRRARGEAAGLRMLAGTIVALGGLGPRAGAGMRRGSIVTMAPATPLATFVFACIYRPPFLRAVPAPAARARAGRLRRAARRSLRALVRRRPRAAARRDPDPGGAHDPLAQRTRAGARRPAGRRRRGAAGRGHDAVQRHAADRLRRAAAGGFEAGRAFAEICMAGLGTVAYAPLVIDGRWLPGADGDHRSPRRRVPGRAVRRLEARSRRLLRDGQRARARADPRRGPLRRPRLGRARERGGAVPGDARRRRRPRSPTSSPSAPACAPVGADAPDGADGEHRRRRADRGARRRDRAAQAPRAGLRRAPGRRRLRQLPAAAGRGRRHAGDRAHQRRRALRRPGPPHRRGRRRRRLRDLVERLPASASKDYGEPFGKVLKDADCDFYKIDPLLFSPAQIRLTSVESGRSFEAGPVNLEVLERSFWG